MIVINKFILASSNPGKVKEFSELLEHCSIKVEQASEKLDVEEKGSTFHENALLKAEAYYDKWKIPSLSDDSGLTVLSLPDELGVYSARFGPPGSSDQEKCGYLLEKLEGVDDRRAFFTCVICCYISPKEYFFFEGILEGTIGYQMEGSYGFGYDPIFIPDELKGDQTLAMVPEWKQQKCHRALAFKHFKDFFTGNVCQI